MTCSWPVDRTCLDATHPLPELDAPPTGDQQAIYDAALARRNNAEDMAVHVLWALSGRRFGVCSTRVRPCVGRTLESEWWRNSYITTELGGHWTLFPCGCAPGPCEVTGPFVVHLPGPVQPDTESSPIVVIVDGVELAHDDYVLEGDALYRKDAPWPHQDLSKPLGYPGTWSVDYGRGIPAPAGVGPMVGRLAAAFLAACNDTACEIPSNLTGTSRRGVSKTFDPAKMLAAKRTGIRDIDMWLGAVNPNGLLAAPEVL